MHIIWFSSSEEPIWGAGQHSSLFLSSLNYPFYANQSHITHFWQTQIIVWQMLSEYKVSAFRAVDWQTTAASALATLAWEVRYMAPVWALWYVPQKHDWMKFTRKRTMRAIIIWSLIIPVLDMITVNLTKTSNGKKFGRCSFRCISHISAHTGP